MAIDHQNKNQRLHHELVESRLSFLQLGLYDITEIQSAVKTQFPNLCDDEVMCRCKFSPVQPEWKHVVRKSLLRYQDNTDPFLPTIERVRDYWAVIPARKSATNLKRAPIPARREPEPTKPESDPVRQGLSAIARTWTWAERR